MNADVHSGVITPVIREGLQKITRQIVEQFHPQKVILFGSYAYGQPTEDSDVDLLVIMETEETPLYAAAHIAAAVDHPFPLHILALQPSDLAFALQEKNIFETEVVNRGVTLYEEENQKVDR
jgi:predicted nucleotidyltransferase